MPFAANFNDTYQLGIKPACEEAGYYCERLDEQIFEERMLDRIYNQIGKADLIVADLSDRNPNVFYETGYAHALGKRVLLLTNKSDDIPFDLRHHFHIVYSSGIAELKKQLFKRASYYITNPFATTKNPFKQLALLVNGAAADLSAEAVVLPAALLMSDDFAIGLIVEISLHLTDEEADEEIEVDVRLISSSSFPTAEHRIGPGTKATYTSIPMRDGRVLHRPLSTSIRLSGGDPDIVVFHLIHDGVWQREDLMTLRLFCSGVRRDLPLRFLRKANPSAP